MYCIAFSRWLLNTLLRSGGEVSDGLDGVKMHVSVSGMNSPLRQTSSSASLLSSAEVVTAAAKGGGGQSFGVALSVGPAFPMPSK